jgi:hypothetical protein
MKIIAPCFTNNKEYANPLVNSLKKYSPEYSDSLILYTDGTTSTDFYHTKMFHAAQAMKNIDDEIVILVDAFDVLVNKPLKNIEEDFKKHECKLLISGEANCFPFKEYESFLSSKSNTKLKFPCAGCWIGYREYMIELFESPLSIENHMTWRRFTDQGFMETIYYNSFHNPYFSVKLDTTANIFINTFLLNPGEDFIINEESKQLTFIDTDSIPYFIHFNGDGKAHMPLFGIKYCG